MYFTKPTGEKLCGLAVQFAMLHERDGLEIENGDATESPFWKYETLEMLLEPKKKADTDRYTYHGVESVSVKDSEGNPVKGDDGKVMKEDVEDDYPVKRFMTPNVDAKIFLACICGKFMQEVMDFHKSQGGTFPRIADLVSTFKEHSQTVKDSIVIPIISIVEAFTTDQMFDSSRAPASMSFKKKVVHEYKTQLDKIKKNQNGLEDKLNVLVKYLDDFIKIVGTALMKMRWEQKIVANLGAIKSVVRILYMSVSSIVEYNTALYDNIEHYIADIKAFRKSNTKTKPTAKKDKAEAATEEIDEILDGDEVADEAADEAANGEAADAADEAVHDPDYD